MGSSPPEADGERSPRARHASTGLRGCGPRAERGARVSPSLIRQMCAVRPIAPAPPGKSRLKQVLSAPALIAIGLGATIGSGIFVLPGTVAAHHSGPAITLSLLVAAFGGGLAALCYSAV